MTLVQQPQFDDPCIPAGPAADSFGGWLMQRVADHKAGRS